jgi:hypothetical protein
MAEETKAILRVADEYVPDISLHLHGGSNSHSQFYQFDYMPKIVKDKIAALNRRIKQTLTDLFDADSAVSKSLGNTLATVADLGMSAAGAFYDGAEAIRIMNDESATLGDKLGLVASAATNLATGFAAGGPWGLALTAITMVISGIL